MTTIRTKILAMPADFLCKRKRKNFLRATKYCTYISSPASTDYVHHITYGLQRRVSLESF